LLIIKCKLELGKTTISNFKKLFDFIKSQKT
jgi:hypothetical protein